MALPGAAKRLESSVWRDGGSDFLESDEISVVDERLAFAMNGDLLPGTDGGEAGLEGIES